MKGHSVCRGGRQNVGKKAPDDGRKDPDAGGKALHDGGISDDGEMGITASLWLRKR